MELVEKVVLPTSHDQNQNSDRYVVFNPSQAVE